MYQTLKVEAQAHGGSSQTTRKQDRSPTLEPEDVNKTLKSPSNTPKEESDDESVVGDLNFKSRALPKHDKMGFTPYFNKNIRELKGPILLTIFNKQWKNTAILYH
ncbi:hypothetical protein PCANC_03027 [Puccinia coronata f. sp. avenae]|uniref:Uncharacterized protein n=1 Tax=Puccinia coronata f. sp. avenae TaxID=200324 RepID=A0A2N5SQA6_9BASI|nr:hypothetical protein PCANC_17928 [Puccinia coronata f. sp. avenae]PLW55955.1 hypothetical protein PCANC_03027 [Puccinia coronata f. sp. avenae]